MSYAASKRGKITSRERQERERALAEAARRAAAARRRRNRILAWGGGALVVVVAALVTVTQVQAAQARAARMGPDNMISDGVVFYGDGEALLALTTEANGPGTPATPTGSARAFGVVDLQVFVDYTDPDAAAFWATNAEEIADRLDVGEASVEIHPIAAGAGSLAPAAALACVADNVPDDAIVAHAALLEAQDRLADAAPADLVAILADAGITDDGVVDCVTKGRFESWVEEATARAAAAEVYPALGAVTGSAVFVLDAPYDAEPDDAEALAEAIDAARDELGVTDEDDTSVVPES